jgi:DEAD/DEAH box helicase domain-containing protein
MTLYEGAIYMIQSAPYQVERLDWEGRKAFVTRTRADYYTDAIDYTRLKILENFAEEKKSESAVAHGEVHLVRRIAGYKKIRYYTHENIGYGNIALPDQEMHTTAVWWQVEPTRLDESFPSRQQALDGFLGAGYAMHHVAAMQMLSEPQDIGRAVGDGNARWFATVGSNGRGTLRDSEGQALDAFALQQFTPTLFLYDNYPGGIGISEPLFGRKQQVVEHAARLVSECECEHGCPSCIGPILAGDEVRGYSPKQAALRVLALLNT